MQIIIMTNTAMTGTVMLLIILIAFVSIDGSYEPRM